MSSYINDSVIQRILIVSSDLIQDKLESTEINYSLGNKGIMLKSKNSMLPQTIIRQQQLFSDSCLDRNSAEELFADNETSIPIDSTYMLKHVLMYKGAIEARPEVRKALFKIDIDKNNILNDGKFFINKIIIKDKPKDSFTLKTNHQVNLSINFSSFEDLIEKNVTADVEYETLLSGDPASPQMKISLLELIYKYLNIGVGIGKEIVDNEGIYLIQKLILSDNSRFKSLKSFNEGDNILYKNYHLTYHKHSFEFAKDSSPFYELYKNEFSIDFMAFETDSVVESEAKPPSINGNLFNLVLSSYKTEIEQYNKVIKTLTNKLAYCSQSSAVPNDTLKSIQDLLSAAIESRNIMNSYIAEELVERIMKKVRIYKLSGELKYKDLNIYKESDISWGQFFGGLAIGSGIAAAFFIPGVGASVGLTLLGMLGPISLDLMIGAFKSTLYSGEFKLSVIKEKIAASSIEKQEITLNYTGARSGRYGDIRSPKDLSADDNLDYNKRLRAQFDLGNKEFYEKYSIKLEDRSKDNEKINLYFLPFGEILKLVKELSERIYMIVGGYILTKSGSASLEKKYVNFANIPISVQTFASFLNKFIIDMDRSLKYDCEVFLRDCFENLIKNSLYDASGYLERNAASVTRDMRMAITIHATDSTVKGFMTNPLYCPKLEIDPSDPDVYEEFVRLFLNTKNITSVKKANELCKIIVIGSYDNVTQYDFLNEYVREETEIIFGKKFQKWMFKHIIPCILINKISLNETILKNKNATFTRIDNPNTVMGNMIASNAILRTPYQVSAELKALFSFFINPGGYIMVAPPAQTSSAELNMFGIGGLYIIIDSQFEYSFQRIQDQKITLPNFESKYSVKASKIEFNKVKTVERVTSGVDPEVCKPGYLVTDEGFFLETE